MRRYQNRARLATSLHDDSEVCLVNLRIYGEPYDAEVVEEADRIQAASEKKASNEGGHRKHGDGMVAQACGPLRKIVLPYGHSRGSQSALVRILFVPSRV